MLNTGCGTTVDKLVKRSVKLLKLATSSTISFSYLTSQAIFMRQPATVFTPLTTIIPQPNFALSSLLSSSFCSLSTYPIDTNKLNKGLMNS